MKTPYTHHNTETDTTPTWQATDTNPTKRLVYKQTPTHLSRKRPSTTMLLMMMNRWSSWAALRPPPPLPPPPRPPTTKSPAVRTRYCYCCCCFDPPWHGIQVSHRPKLVPELQTILEETHTSREPPHTAAATELQFLLHCLLSFLEQGHRDEWAGADDSSVSSPPVCRVVGVVGELRCLFLLLLRGMDGGESAESGE